MQAESKYTRALMSDEMKMGKISFNNRQAVTLVAAVMLLLLYMMIFSFSAQDAEQSGGLSHRISETCVEIAESVAGRAWTDVVKGQLVDAFEHPIRKMAHFMEYCYMGVLVYAMWCPWLERGRRLYGLVVIWVFLSAAGDEFHQLFVPGRYGSFSDVMLDTCGGIAGLLLGLGVKKIIRHVVKRNAGRRQTD